MKRDRLATHSSFATTIVRTDTGIATTIIQGRIPEVTAICWAPESGDIFLGFASGEVACFRPLRGEVTYLPKQDEPVASLAASSNGDMLAVLRMEEMGKGCLSCFCLTGKTGDYQSVASQEIRSANSASFLSPLLAGENDLFIGLWTGGRLQFLCAPRLLSVESLYPSNFEAPPAALTPSAAVRLSAPWSCCAHFSRQSGYVLLFHSSGHSDWQGFCARLATFPIIGEALFVLAPPRSQYA